MELPWAPAMFRQDAEQGRAQPRPLPQPAAPVDTTHGSRPPRPGFAPNGQHCVHKGVCLVTLPHGDKLIEANSVLQRAAPTGWAFSDRQLTDLA